MVSSLPFPHLNEISWNFKEELVKSIRQSVNPGNGTAETTYYQYDGQGQRIRKITENSAAQGITPTIKEQRIYIAGYEWYKKHTGNHAGLERVSLSLLDEGHRFVMIETRNTIDDGSAKELVRYQLHNHLGSAALELDDTAQIISYEEYHPYGTTAYQAKNASIKSTAKRYRYTGMERDEETGLSYHSARYYLPWLGRWLSTDPIGIGDGVNLYGYCQNSPLMKSDKSGKQANSGDPTDPKNFITFESFQAANSVQPKNILWDVWSEVHGSKAIKPLQKFLPKGKTANRTHPSFEKVAKVTVKILDNLRLIHQHNMRPIGLDGKRLQGPMITWTGEVALKKANQYAKEGIGWTVQQTPFHKEAEAKVAELKKAKGTSGTTSPEDYKRHKPIWDEASKKAVTCAELSGCGTTSANKAPGSETPIDPKKTQAIIELPLSKRLRFLVAGVSAVLGGLNVGMDIHSAVAEDTPDIFRPLHVIGASLEGTGLAAYLIGAAGGDAAMMASGVAIAETGGLILAPVVYAALTVPFAIEADKTNQQMAGPAKKLEDEGNDVGAALTLGSPYFLSTY